MRNTLPVVIGLAVTLLCFGQAEAMPLSPQGLAASSDVQTVAYVGAGTEVRLCVARAVALRFAVLGAM